MYNDADVETYAARLRSSDSAVRALAADEATDGVSDWGQHAYTPTQADHIAPRGNQQHITETLSSQGRGALFCRWEGVTRPER